MKNEVYTIEDCLELLTGLKGQAKFQIERSDQNFLNSIGRQTFKGIALTDKQHTVIKEKLLGYRDQFTVLDYDIDLYLDTLRMPLREIDRSKYIKICDGITIPPYIGTQKGKWIKIRFPFSKSLIIKVEDISRTLKKDNHYHEKGSHEHYFKLCERAVFEIVNKFGSNNFTIDQDVVDLYDQLVVMDNNKEKYVPGVYNLKLKNLSDRATAYMISSIGSEPTVENLALYKDRQDLFGLHYFDNQDLISSLNNFSTLSKNIINRTSSNVFVHNEKYTFNNLSETLLELNRFPLLVVLTQETPLDDLYKVHTSLNGFIEKGQSSVLFRLDNENNSEFNKYIKSNSLNSPLDKNTKVVYINNNNITKPLIQSKWKASAVLLLSSGLLVSKVKTYVDECDLIIHYDKTVSQHTRVINGIQEV